MGHLPPYPTPFVGRQDELAQISALLADPACRLLTLVGPGGIGKTRLAVEAARQQSVPQRRPLRPAPAAHLARLHRVRHCRRPRLPVLTPAPIPGSSFSTTSARNRCCWCWITWNILLDGVTLLSEILALRPPFASSPPRANG